MENKLVEALPFRDKQAQGDSDCEQENESAGQTNSQTNSQTARPDTDNSNTLNAGEAVARKGDEEEHDTPEETTEAPVAKKKKRKNKKSRGKKKVSIAPLRAA